MAKLEENKQQTENNSIQKVTLPEKVFIPLSQHLGKICAPLVSPGDRVLTGQKIASSEVKVFSPVHASLSGNVVAVEDWPHPVLGRSKAIIIESDGKDSLFATVKLSEKQVSALTPEQIREKVFDSGIVGMGGAGFPSNIKLNPAKPLQALIVNGAECEPFLTGDNRLMVEKTKEIILGIGLVAKAVGVKQVFVAIEDNKPEAIKAFRRDLAGSDYKLKVLRSVYPQGGEKQLIKSVFGKEVPQGKLPFDVGALVHNIATVYAIYEAVYLGKPLYERVVTVTGDCLENPGNLLLRIGTPVKDLIKFCGPLKQEPKKIIFGGPMMGIAQYSLDTPVIKTTNGVMFLSEVQEKPLKNEVCIRCSRCVRECPAGLMPCMISMASENEKWDLAKDYGCLDCIECGLCTYVCPQERNIVQQIKLAKTRMTR